MGRVVVWVLAASLAIAPASGALAQGDDDEEAEQDESADDSESGDDEGEASDDEEADGDEGETSDDAEEGEAGEEGETDKDEAAAARQWFFGPYFRYQFVPAFMLELFLDAAPTVANPAFGVAATYRTVDGPLFEMGIGYASYAFEDPFRAKGDPNTDTEWVDSSLGLVHLTGSILWAKPIVEEKLFFEYGVGLDVGIVTGELVRTEAYFNSAAHQYMPCLGPANPPAQVAYCAAPNNPLAGTDAYDQDGEHYHVVEERVPPIALMPMLPRLGLRYDPLPELAFKFEAAYGIAQIWLGLSAAYAPEL